MTSRMRWVVALTAIGSLMAALDTLVVSTALSTIRIDLHATVEQLEWTVNAYNLSLAVLMITATALGDRFGRRRLYAVGLGLFAAASAASALAPGVGVLIAARAVQGAGAALILPLGLAILSGVFGIAIAVAVFAAAGSYGSAELFVDGFVPAISVAAGISALGAVVGLALPGRRQALSALMRPALEAER